MEAGGASIAAAIQRDLRRLPDQRTPTVRAVRRSYARQLADETPSTLLAVVKLLLAGGAWPERVVAFELLKGEDEAFRTLDDDAIDRMASGLSDWGSVDLYGVTIAGPAWRMRLLSDKKVKQWARSTDRWLRRLALVATVGLNSRARGGTGNTTRTLAVCRMVKTDRDPMVVKALSWALRELAKHDAESVLRFITLEREHLSALVKREVRNKLETGLKDPGRSSPSRA